METAKVLILDVETTGISNIDQIVELAHITCPDNMREWVADFVDYHTIKGDEILGFIVPGHRVYNERFNPSVPINPHAFKVHGITKLSLLKCRPSSEAVIPSNTKYLIGHNISFDHRMLGKPDVLLIDTLVLTRTLRKLGMITNNDDDGKDRLDVLIAHYFPTVASTLIKPLHSALSDCYKVILLLSIILEKLPDVHTWEALFTAQTPGKKK